MTGAELTADLRKALTWVLGDGAWAPDDPIPVLASYLDKLKEGYGFSESIRAGGGRDLPSPAPVARPVIEHYLPGVATGDDEAVRGQLYKVAIELSGAPDARTKVRDNGINETDLRYLAQVFWNLEQSPARPDLPIQAGQNVAGVGRPLAIRVPGTNRDFADMQWTERLKEPGTDRSSGPHKSTAGAFRNQGARLAVLAAQRIIEENTRPFVADRAPSSPTSATVSPAFQQHAPIVTSRARACLVIDSFEQDLRELVESLLLDHLAPERVFGPLFHALTSRPTHGATPETLVEVLLPQEAYDVLLDHANHLPADLTHILQGQRSAFDLFLRIRNRVVRDRPLQFDDLNATESVVSAFSTERFRRTRDALAHLATDTDWQPRRRQTAAQPERVLHNLPAPDFDETGLLGREDEVLDVVRLLKRPSNRMITLVGEGGIGKTALALEICYRLADEPDPPFQAILWSSLKRERLTPEGVTSIANTIRDIDGAANVLGRALSSTFEGSVSALADAIGTLRTLIVIDNLETVHGAEVVRLHDDLPDGVTFLFTSRVGVGQLDRHSPVGPLGVQSAEQLFRGFAQSRRQTHLAELSTPRLAEVLGELRYSPLAIRWYILSVEAGVTPREALRSQDDLLRFCVGNVVEALSNDERQVLDVLMALDQPVSYDKLAVISGMEIEALRRSALRLSQSSLLVWGRTSDPDDLDELLSLSSTARAYLRGVTDLLKADEIQRKEEEYNQERERERGRIADHGRYLDYHVIFERSPNDEATAHLLQVALREDRSGHPEEANATLERARRLSPGYFEVDRVEAVIAGFRRETARSSALYRSALSVCETDEETAWVSHFFATHLARQVKEVPEAITLAQRAHDLFDTFDTALQLGNFYVWDHRFDDGRKLIERALERAPDKPRFPLMATASLVECYQRWSASELAEERLAEALDHALDAVETGISLHESGTTDEVLLRKTTEAAFGAIRVAHAIESIGPTEGERFVSALGRLASDGQITLLPRWKEISVALSTLPPDLRSRFDLGQDAPARIRGTVLNVGKTYGFISHTDHPDNVFFHAGSFVPPWTMRDVEPGAEVEFTVAKDARGKTQASGVTIPARSSGA